MTAVLAEQPRVVILLSTFNGQDYLPIQLDSLLAQDYQDFVVLVRDDGSQDGTQALLEHYAAASPSLFHLMPTEGGNIGPSRSFGALMTYGLAQKAALGLDQAYMMFCDQDDCWHPNKIRICMHAMLALESKHPYRACLVHSDLRVVNASGDELAPSFFEYQSIRPHKHSFARLLISNSVTGCAAMINEKLAYLATPIPSEAVMHDWWLALVAASVGHIRPIDEALLDYRQHERNALGAKQYLASGFSMQKLRKLSDPAYDEISAQILSQAESFAGLHYANLKSKDVFLLSIVLWMRSPFRWVRNAVLFGFLTLFR